MGVIQKQDNSLGGRREKKGGPGGKGNCLGGAGHKEEGDKNGLG